LSNGEARRGGVWVSGIQEGLRRFAVLWDVAVKRKKERKKGEGAKKKTQLQCMIAAAAGDGKHGNG
jgi:hypothetical protein